MSIVMQWGHIDFSLGLSVKLKLEKLEMSLPKKGDLVKVEDLIVKIPIWAVLTGGGTIEIELQKPLLNYMELPKGNNWTMAMGDKDKKAPAPKAAPTEPAKAREAPTKGEAAAALAVPGFVANSRLNLKLKDVMVTYQLKDKSSGKVELSRFLIKNLNFKSETAFEIASKMKFNMGKDNSAAFQTLVIGTFNLAEMIEKETFSTMFIVTLSDFDVSSITGQIPNIKTEVKALVDKKGQVKGSVETSFEDRNKISANYAVLKDGIKVDDIKVALFIQDLTKIVGFSNPMLDMEKSQLNLDGKVAIDKNQKITPFLSFSLNPGIEFKQDLVSGSMEVKGSFERTRIKISQIAKLLSGSITANINGDFDPNLKNFDMGKLKPFQMDVAFNQLNFSREMIQGVLYGGKKEAKPADKPGAEATEAPQAEAANTAGAKTPLVLPPGTLNIAWNGMKIGPEDFNGKAKILIGGSAITTENLSFNYSKGEGKLTHSTKFKSGYMDNNFNFQLDNLDLLGLKTFLPPMLEAITGTFSGKVSGGAKLFDDPKKGLTHNVKVDVSAVNGEIKGLDLKKKVEEILKTFDAARKIAGKASRKVPDITDEYESLKFAGTLKQDHYQIQNAEFIGLKKLVEVKNVRGNLYPQSTTKEGQANADVKLKVAKVEKVAKNEFGLDAIPVPLKGIGFGLSPDVGALSKTLVKAFTKHQTKKAVGKAKSKAKQKVQKAIDKQLKKVGGDKLKDAGKKLLKKFKLPF